jgi:hypothetical protein
MTSVATCWELADDDTIMNKFHLSGRVNRHSLRVWGSDNPHGSFEHERDSPNINAFAAMSQEKLYESTVTGIIYLPGHVTRIVNAAAAGGHSRPDLSTWRCPAAFP